MAGARACVVGASVTSQTYFKFVVDTVTGMWLAMSMSFSAHSNNTSHFLVTTSTGETFGEKCRDSLGGFDNMMKRVATRLGADRLRPLNGGDTWTANGTTVTFDEMSAR